MLIDLTRTISEDIPNVAFEQFRTVAKDGWNAKMLHLYSHSGTHMDAPWHFECAEQYIDQTPLERCTGMAEDVRLPETAPRELLTVAHLGAVAGTFRRGDHLLLQTNWSERFGDPAYGAALPRISDELAGWCVERGVGILGVEPPSVADTSDLEEVTRIHRTLLGGGVTIVEGLVHLDRIPVDRCFFAALPLKILQGDGAPCRAFASTEPLGFS